MSGYSSSNGLIAHIGYSENDHPVYLELSSKAHFLIAGVSGSGKTTLLHAIICGIIQEYDEAEAQFILITSGKSGFSYYKNVPNMCGPVAVSETDIRGRLQSICAEIHQRQLLMSQNKHSSVKFSHVFVVVDSFSRMPIITRLLVYRNIKEIVTNGSSVNVHLLLATDRFGIRFLWRSIIDFFPNRFVFRSRNAAESRFLLETDAASLLQQTGEAYYMNESGQPRHLFCCKVSVKETVKPYNDAVDAKAKALWESEQQKMRLQTTFEQLDPYQFEEFVALRMRECGFTHVQVTQKSGDYGADVLGTDPLGQPVCVQCKQYKGSVGFDAVQQINTARDLFHCKRAILITNSTVTKQAQETANRLQVEIIQRFSPSTILH